MTNDDEIDLKRWLWLFLTNGVLASIFFCVGWIAARELHPCPKSGAGFDPPAPISVIPHTLPCDCGREH